MSIDIRALPKEIRDTIEIREATDTTFSRFVDEDFSDIFWSKLSERSDPNVEHSILLSIVGEQGSGKCIFEDIVLRTKKGYCRMKDLMVGDEVFGDAGQLQRVCSIWKTRKKCIEFRLAHCNDVIVSEDHRMVTSNGLKLAKDVKKGDLLLCEDLNGLKDESRVSIDKSFFIGAYLADGYISIRGEVLRIGNANLKFIRKLKNIAIREFKFTSVKIFRRKKVFELMCWGSKEVGKFCELFGRKCYEKRLSVDVLYSRSARVGFLKGYSDIGIKLSRAGVNSVIVHWSFKSDLLAMAFVDILHKEGFYPYVRKRRNMGNGRWKNVEYVFVRLSTRDARRFLDLTGRKFKSDGKRVKIIKNERMPVEISGKMYVRVEKKTVVGLKSCVDINVTGNKLFVVAGGLVVHNSLSALTMCCFMDPNFSIENIYFNYNDLVYNRHMLKKNTAVLVDEQSELFGLDSHRVNIVLQNLKEQLRKRSVHMFFCSPTLYPESRTSMYIVETIFIDFSTKEVYAALKTRDGLTLGHIRIPHPLKVLDDGTTMASKELVDAYELKKDAHLEHILGQKNIDIFEDQAENVMKNKLFKMAERVYVGKMGYIPNGALVQLINKIFPEYQAGVVPLEIAGRIKLNKEISGKWEVAGKVTRKDRAGGKPSR